YGAHAHQHFRPPVPGQRQFAARTVVPTPPPAPANPPVAPQAPAPLELSISSPLSPPLTFNTTRLTASAGAQVTLSYSNDSPIAHNWHLFDGPDSSATSIAATQIIS